MADDDTDRNDEDADNEAELFENHNALVGQLFILTSTVASDMGPLAEDNYDEYRSSMLETRKALKQMIEQVDDQLQLALEVASTVDDDED